MKGSTVLILDPMLATGGSASQAISFIKQYEPATIKLVNIIAAPEGVERIKRDHDDITLFLGVLDRQLNEQGYILPGLGDAGDRIYGT
jgi:uracil phosphoribosyltransferase